VNAIARGRLTLHQTARESYTQLWRVGVVVPARDEEDRIEACLAAISAAVRAAGCPAVTCVVADRCTDTTAALARAAGADVVVNQLPRRVGTLRNIGLERVGALLGGVTERIWLLSTDADTLVPSSWVDDHLRHAEAGADAVAGAVDLDDPHVLPADVLARYSRLVASRVAERTHGHAYAANLGVRADAFRAVGGYPAVAYGEEHALLGRLRRAGFRVVSPTDVRARTSARTEGRAQGGLADLLRTLA
jgi:glycosyltransferase involved in cell wall biosynthesis